MNLQFAVPLKVQVSKKKHFVLNLNQYRNAHHRVLSTAKNNFTDIIMALDLPKVSFDVVTIHYQIYPTSKRKYDGMNVVSVIDKFVCDALVKRGVLPDDNINHVIGTSWEAKQVDKDNPRVEVLITEKK